MNIDQFQQILNKDLKERTISIEDVSEKHDRTLLYGYDIDRNTHHVYIKNDQICLIVYNFAKEIISFCDGIIPLYRLIPNKRLYPERCDFSFCNMLQEYGIHFPWTTFDEKWTNSNNLAFFGKTKED